MHPIERVVIDRCKDPRMTINDDDVNNDDEDIERENSPHLLFSYYKYFSMLP